jgi:hypothetical protein
MPARRTATADTANRRTSTRQRRAAGERARAAGQRTRDADLPVGEDEDLAADEEEDLPTGEEDDRPAVEEDLPVGEDADVPAEEEEEEEEDAPARGNARRLSAAAAAQAGKQGLLELIGKRAEGITAVEPVDDGWRVAVEVLEDQRVPSSADLLALYEVELDPEGNLVSYRRTRRYARGRGDDGGDRR